jgi:hypothetical protein
LQDLLRLAEPVRALDIKRISGVEPRKPSPKLCVFRNQPRMQHLPQAIVLCFEFGKFVRTQNGNLFCSSLPDRRSRNTFWLAGLSGGSNGMDNLIQAGTIGLSGAMR